MSYWRTERPSWRRGWIVGATFWFASMWGLYLASPQLSGQWPNAVPATLALPAWLAGELASGAPFKWVSAPVSNARGWVVGLAVFVAVAYALERVLPAVAERSWAQWFVILASLLAGALSAGKSGTPIRDKVSETLWVVAVLVVLVGSIGVVGWVLHWVVNTYGILGVIAILLGTIAVMLAVLVARGKNRG